MENISDAPIPSIPRETQNSIDADAGSKIEEPVTSIACVPEFTETETTQMNFDVDEQLPEDIFSFGEPKIENRNIVVDEVSRTKTEENIMLPKCLSEFGRTNAHTEALPQEPLDHQELLVEDSQLNANSAADGSHITVQHLSNRVAKTKDTGEVSTDRIIDNEELSSKSSAVHTKPLKFLERFKFHRKPRDLAPQEKRKIEESNTSSTCIASVSKKLHNDNMEIHHNTQVPNAVEEIDNNPKELLRSQFDTEEDVDLDF